MAFQIAQKFNRKAAEENSLLPKTEKRNVEIKAFKLAIISAIFALVAGCFACGPVYHLFEQLADHKAVVLHFSSIELTGVILCGALTLGALGYRHHIMKKAGLESDSFKFLRWTLFLFLAVPAIVAISASTYWAF